MSGLACSNTVADVVDVVNPSSLAPPRGYSNGLLFPAGGRVLFVSGQVGWDRERKFPSDDFAAQFQLALANTLEVVRAAGGGPEHVGRLTIFVTDKREYNARIKEIGAVYRTHMGKNFPAMALVQVAALLEDEAKVEIEATAVIP